MSLDTSKAVIYVQIPQDKWLQMESELKEIKEILLSRTLPKKLIPYTIKEIAVALRVSTPTINRWIYSSKITNKPGVVSCEKKGGEYVIMVDEDQLK